MTVTGAGPGLWARRRLGRPVPDSESRNEMTRSLPAAESLAGFWFTTQARDAERRPGPVGFKLYGLLAESLFFVYTHFRRERLQWGHVASRVQINGIEQI